MKPQMVTFTKWSVTPGDRRPVSVNPHEVSDVEDYCGDVDPGSIITMKNKKTYFVQGVHADIVAKLKGQTMTPLPQALSGTSRERELVEQQLDVMHTLVEILENKLKELS